MMLARAWIMLLWLSFRRLLWSSHSLMVALPLVGCALIVWRLRLNETVDMGWAFNRYSQWFVFVTYASIVLPLCVLAFSASSVGGDREDRTLLFVLMRPIPRALVLLAKWCATLPLVLGLVAASFALYCRMAGDVGSEAFELYLAPLLAMAAAYGSLFLLCSVLFRHSTVIALVYSLFFESIIGNLPGIVKRLTVNFYGRSWMHLAGEPHGLRRPDEFWFEPVDIASAQWALALWTLIPLVLAAIIFVRREYRDLT